MTLRVPFEQFVPTAKRLLGNVPAYLLAQGDSTRVTAGDPSKAIIVSCIHHAKLHKTRDALKTQGLEVFEGQWCSDGLAEDSTIAPSVPYIAAVSYKSSEEMPGLWVDAYPELPTQVTVLKNLYEEFRGTGQIADVSFEEFVRMANPNVVIASPEEVSSFVRQKEG